MKFVHQAMTSRGVLFLLIVSVWLAADCALADQGEVLFPVRSGGKWGYIDKTGQLKIQPQYDYAFEFAEGLAAICTGVTRWSTGSPEEFPEDGKWGYIDQTGTVIIQPQFEFASSFSEGAAHVRTAGKSGFIDRTGQWVIPAEFSWADNFSDGLAGAEQSGLWGYIDRKGQWKITPQFKWVDQFSEGLAHVQLPDGTMRFITQKADPVKDHVPQGSTFLGCRFKEQLACFQDGERFGYMDEHGQVTIQPQFAIAHEFSEGLAPVCVGSPIKVETQMITPAPPQPPATRSCGFIDRSGKFVIPPQFDAAMGFSEERAVAERQGRLGVIDREGRWVVQPTFRMAYPFNHGLARVYPESMPGFGYVDRNGAFVWHPTE